METITYTDEDFDPVASVELKTISNSQAYTLTKTQMLNNASTMALHFASLFVSGENVPDEFGDPIPDFDATNDDHLNLLDFDFVRQAMAHTVDESRLKRKARKNSS